MSDSVYLKSSDSGLVDIDLNSDDLNLDLNLSTCVGEDSVFINYGTGIPTSQTKGRIYIQLA